jgi:hypothetical protein
MGCLSVGSTLPRPFGRARYRFLPSSALRERVPDRAGEGVAPIVDKDTLIRASRTFSRKREKGKNLDPLPHTYFIRRPSPPFPLSRPAGEGARQGG